MIRPEDNMFEPIEIPNKSSFKINEVCALTGVKSYVLRFWESEFTEIAPMISSTGLKVYVHRDIEAILLIKKLLFEDKLTIERARGEMKILMPREYLVEDSFNDFNDGEVAFAPQSYPHQTKRVLAESDIQKLIKAKAKLSEILFLTQALHEKNHWG
jgi:DNA-binding transcriptional MerR regulator